MGLQATPRPPIHPNGAGMQGAANVLASAVRG
jgi:hypothetical protein